jgi:hypothetical protein
MQLHDVKIHGSLGNLLANLAEKIVGVTNAVIAQVGFQTPLAQVSRLVRFSQYQFRRQGLCLLRYRNSCLGLTNTRRRHVRRVGRSMAVHSVYCRVRR